MSDRSIDWTLTDRDFSEKESLEPSLRPYDPAHDRELMRSRTALVLIGTLPATILLTFVFLSIKSWKNDSVTASDFKDVLTIIVAPLIGVIGTIAGFYFARQDN
jgi:hypothetical protein